MTDLRPLAGNYPNEASLKNNNPSGISYFGDNGFTKALTDSGINWSVGTSRPSKEGAKYVSFASAEDGMKAHELLWSAPKYQSMKVGDALTRWGTGNLNISVDSNKKIKDLSKQEIMELQKAQIQKESPGFYKEYLSKTSPASSTLPVSESLKTAEPARTIKTIDDARGFFMENGGFGEKEKSAVLAIMDEYQIDKDTAIIETALAKQELLDQEKYGDSGDSGEIARARERLAQNNYWYEEQVSDVQDGVSVIKPGVSLPQEGSMQYGSTTTAQRGEVPMSSNMDFGTFLWNDIEKLPVIGNFAYWTRVGLSQAGEQLGNAIVKAYEGKPQDAAAYLGVGWLNAILSNPVMKSALTPLMVWLTAAQDIPYAGDALRSVFNAIHKGSSGLLGEYNDGWKSLGISSEAFNDIKNTVGNITTALVPGAIAGGVKGAMAGARAEGVGAGFNQKLVWATKWAVTGAGKGTVESAKGLFENPLSTKAPMSKVAPPEFVKKSLRNGVEIMYKIDKPNATEKNVADLVRGVNSLEGMTGIKVKDLIKEGYTMPEIQEKIRTGLTEAQGKRVEEYTAIPLDVRKIEIASQNPLKIVDGKAVQFKNMSPNEVNAVNEAIAMANSNLRTASSVKDAVQATQQIKEAAYKEFDSGNKQKAEAMLAVVNSIESAISSQSPQYRENLQDYFAASRLMDAVNATKNKPRFEGIVGSASPLTLSLFGGALASGHTGVIGSSLIGILGSAIRAKQKDPARILNWASELSDMMDKGQINRADIEALGTQTDRTAYDAAFNEIAKPSLADLAQTTKPSLPKKEKQTKKESLLDIVGSETKKSTATNEQKPWAEMSEWERLIAQFQDKLSKQKIDTQQTKQWETAAETVRNWGDAKIIPANKELAYNKEKQAELVYNKTKTPLLPQKWTEMQLKPREVSNKQGVIALPGSKQKKQEPVSNKKTEKQVKKSDNKDSTNIKNLKNKLKRLGEASMKSSGEAKKKIDAEYRATQKQITALLKK